VFLNRENRWLDFTWSGLEIGPDGALRLETLPIMTADAAPSLHDQPCPSGSAGLVVVPDGTIYWIEPDRARLLRIDACDPDHRATITCIRGPGHTAGELLEPRGLAYHRGRRSLLVADSGNDRIQVFDLSSLQLVEIWGRRGQGPGELDAPTSLAVDRAGNTYVVDSGNHRVQKFDVRGTAVPGFWEALLGRAGPDVTPAEVTVTEASGQTRVLVLDARAGAVHRVDDAGHGWVRWDLGTERAVGLAAAGSTVYVGDNERRQLLVVRNGHRVGSARGYAGPVAAVALDSGGDVLVLPGGGCGPVRLTAEGACRKRGAMAGGPFHNPDGSSDPWHLVRATLGRLAPEAHFQIFVCSRPRGAPAPPMALDQAEPFTDPDWQRSAVAPDCAEVLISGAPLDDVWLGMTFVSGGLVSPDLSQVRIDFAHPTLLEHLPGTYRKDAVSRWFLARWLTLFESRLDEVREEIDSLASSFDPDAVEERLLPWLAGWLDVDLSETRSALHRRAAISGAFAADARRGTVRGLTDCIRDATGAEVVIEEPINQTQWWALPDEPSGPGPSQSLLGYTSVLAAAEPAAAVVGGSAVLDASFLSDQADYATPLFADVAHQFSVRLYRGRTYSEETLSTVRHLLDSQKPAHTLYHLCVVEPRLRVGYQARLGVDSIISGPVEPTPLESAPGGLILAGGPTDSLGESTRVGLTHLTQS